MGGSKFRPWYQPWTKKREGNDSPPGPARMMTDMGLNFFTYRLESATAETAIACASPDKSWRW